MTILISGGAGFIGPNLIKRLVQAGQDVAVADNFSRGRRENLDADVHVISVDLSRPESVDLVAESLHGCTVDEVWHLAANSDIPAGVEDPSVDLRDTFLSTFHLLELTRRIGARRFYFASSSAVYGDCGTQQLAESMGPLLPISNYGAMKLASEAQI